MSNSVSISRRYKARGFIRVEQSRNDSDLLFISTPSIVELTKDEAYSLIETLTKEANNLWGNK